MDDAQEQDDLAIELEPAEPALPVWRPRPDGAATALECVERGAPVEPELYLHVRAVETMFEDAREHRSVETGGLLVGQLCEDGAGQYLRVTAALRAPHADRSATSLTFTQESWAAMIDARRRSYPGNEVVGWYHTHPGMPVLLSEPDRFIHRSFFSRPQDIAIVIDLERLRWAPFRWEGRELVVAAHFYVYGESPEDGTRVLDRILAEFPPHTAKD